jgi:hypothetical protein
VNSNYRKNINGIVFLIVSITALLFLNLDFIHYQSLALWAKLLPPTLLLIGFWGSLSGLTLFRFTGWIGIVLFLLVSLLSAFPTEDYVLGGVADDPGSLPRDVSNAAISARLAVGSAISILLAWLYRRLKLNSKTKDGAKGERTTN